MQCGGGPLCGQRIMSNGGFRPTPDQAKLLRAIFIWENQPYPWMRGANQDPGTLADRLWPTNPQRLSHIPNFLIRATVATLPGEPPLDTRSILTELAVARCLKDKDGEPWPLPVIFRWQDPDGSTVQLIGRGYQGDEWTGVEIEVAKNGVHLYRDSVTILDEWQGQGEFRPECSAFTSLGRHWAQRVVDENLDVVPVPALAPPTHDQTEDIVTLDQAAAIAKMSKRTLDRYLQNDKLPRSDYPGGGGKAHKWKWSTLRPALSKAANRPLPDRFPGSRIV